jgi:hypothetical protein
MPDINNTAGLVRWKPEMVCEMITSGDKNILEFTCQFEYFSVGIPGGCRFRNSDYFVSFKTQNLAKPVTYAFVKDNLRATASFSVARNEAYSRQALMSSTVSRGKFLRIVS